MIIEKQEALAVLRQFNPWWAGNALQELPNWHRQAYHQLFQWIENPPAPRAILLSGARQVGKTTLLLQAVQGLLATGTQSNQILYATFDHPILKLLGLEATIQLWREYFPEQSNDEYLLLDEIQYTKDWTIWLKHQVDFNKKRRIAVTGSAVPLSVESPESGVGRWHTIKLPTLSFPEYLQIKRIEVPELPDVASLVELFDWPARQREWVSQQATPLVAHFHDYLLRGGFPQTARMESVSLAQKLTREDIIDKVLKRDMTALYGVRRILELEKIFLYLCLHDGGILDVTQICKSLELKRPTVNKYIDLLESVHLIYKLHPFGYGKQVLRGRCKIYLADAAMAGSVLLKGTALLEDATRLGQAVETAFFKHVFTRYYSLTPRFSYWRHRSGQEVDIIAEVKGEIVPFEIKYSRSRVDNRELKGMLALCRERSIKRAYVITRDLADFEILPVGAGDLANQETRIMKVPALLACYWLSNKELGVR
jgi:hypothetical protein